MIFSLIYDIMLHKEANFKMIPKTTATFIGHSECYGITKEQIKQSVLTLIDNGVTDFLCGGQGKFDNMCARCVYELKKDFPNIKNHLIIPYLSFKINDKEIYDDILFPEGFEKYHFKKAIPMKNNFLVDNSEYAVCYITHDWGGATKTFQRAKKKNLKIINLANKNANGS